MGRRKRHRKHSCQTEGCQEQGKPCWFTPGTRPDAYHCFDHRADAGFCIGCGLFYAGIERFDFGPGKGYCEHCWYEICQDYYCEQHEGEDDYGSWDYFDDPNYVAGVG